MEKKERLFINVVKGTAIFLMLWGHCIEYCANGSFNVYENPVFRWIYSFHMPLFMLVSGYLFYFSFHKRELKPLLVHRTQGMLQPIVFAGMLNQLLMLLLYRLFGMEVSVLGGGLVPENLFSFWFLWCVLSSSIAVGIACKVTDKLWLQCVFLAAGVGLLVLFPNYDLHLCMYPYFILGFFYGKYRHVLPKWFRNLKYAALVLFPVLLPFFQTKHYIYMTPVYSRENGILGSLELNLFRIAMGLAGSVAVMVIVWEIVKRSGETDILSKLLKPFAKMGENSLQIYCISMSVLSGYLPELYPKFMESVGYDVFAGHMGLYNFAFTPLLAAAYAVLICVMVAVLKKIRLHSLIFGR